MFVASLSFKQVADEIIDEIQITQGQYDSVCECIYDVPSYIAIGILLFHFACTQRFY